MKKTRNIAGAVVALLIAAQGLAQDAASDRVLAKIGQETISGGDLRFEMADADLPASLREAAERTTLQGLIDRKLLVEEAQRRKLDATPIGAMTLKRANDLALIAVLERSLTANLPPLPDEQVAKYVSDHPATFARRKRIWVDQLQIAIVDPETVKLIAPLETMGEITALLNRTQVVYIRSAAVLDTMDMIPDAAATITRMNPNAVFITPKGGGGLEVSQITSTKLEPVTGAAAAQAARQYLTHARTKAVAQASMTQIIKAGQANVKLNPQYNTPGI